MFLNKNIANDNCFQTNHKYTFYKNSIQPQKTKQHTTLLGNNTANTKKQNSLFLENMKLARKYI